MPGQVLINRPHEGIVVPGSRSTSTALAGPPQLDGTVRPGGRLKSLSGRLDPVPVTGRTLRASFDATAVDHFEFAM